jgi:cephalosporin hydroxylase
VDIDSEKWDKEVDGGKDHAPDVRADCIHQGDSVSEGVLHEVLRHANGKRGLVLLDSLHSKEHVLKELNLYSKFVAEGSYLIVNDTHLEVLGIMGPDKEGALSAVQEFLKSTNEFAHGSEFSWHDHFMLAFRVSQEEQVSIEAVTLGSHM